jgi:hypothetical protein
MQKSTLILFFIFLLFSCNKNNSNENLEITGNIIGFKKGTLYIQKVKDTSLITLDTIKINGDSHFTTKLNIESPEMYYLFLDRGISNSLDNTIPFFAEKGKINIESSLDFFTSDAKISGSKNQVLYDEYKKVASKFIDQELYLTKIKFNALKNKKTADVQLIEDEQNSTKKRKYLYTTNFAVNHSDYEIAPYLALSEIPDINIKYLDTIEKSLTPNISKSLYGIKLKKLIEERKKSE